MKYCDRDCQRLHWFAHKKACKPPSTEPAPDTSSQNTAQKEIDSAEISEQLKHLMSK